MIHLLTFFSFSLYFFSLLLTTLIFLSPLQAGEILRFEALNPSAVADRARGSGLESVAERRRPRRVGEASLARGPLRAARASPGAPRGLYAALRVRVPHSASRR